MNYLKKFFYLLDNYMIARLQNRASTALFWYLPEPPNITSTDDLMCYKKSTLTPLYLIDYRQKLKYSLENKDGIIVLPYHKPIGNQINPEAAFQYALGLHDQYCLTKQQVWLDKFFKYADYFINIQSKDGSWNYEFDWYTSKAPWHSALAQARGASVMLRAWLYTKNIIYLDAAKKALNKFSIPTHEDGFLHYFAEGQCFYFEEYPKTPTGVINGFMASLISIWELNYWINEKWLNDLWNQGMDSLKKMLPYYTTGWWSIYDLDDATPLVNVNSPRYHLLEMHYLKVLSILAVSPLIEEVYETRKKQYHKLLLKYTALGTKLLRKIIYK